jgi:hypothetical protein
MSNEVQYTSATDGSVGVFPSESGMVGTINKNGYWVMWIPRKGVTYYGDYWGRKLSVENIGNGVYMLVLNGITRFHAYSENWKMASFFDLMGYQVGSMDAAVLSGERPSQMYFQPGAVVDPAIGVALINGTDPNTPPQTTPIAQPTTQPPVVITPAPVVNNPIMLPPPQTLPQTSIEPQPQPQPQGVPNVTNNPTQNNPNLYARASNGNTTEFAGDAGLVGVYSVDRQAWYMYIPAPGIQYEAFYWGNPISMKNNGDGTYHLLADGVGARRNYNPRWVPGAFYDASGRMVSSPSAAVVKGDPADVFFIPGELTIERINTTTSSTPVRLPPVVTTTNQQPAPLPQTQPPAGSPLAPVAVEFPPAGPEGPPGPLSGKLFALAAIAAVALLS